MPRERALGEFFRERLRPLSARDDVTQYIHILWEAVRPTAVYRKLVSEEAAPFMGFAVDLIRRFLPDADQRTLVMAAVWLMGQCAIYLSAIATSSQCHPFRSLLMSPASTDCRLLSAAGRLPGLRKRVWCRRHALTGRVI
jgi:hypothetical protein